MLAPKYTRRLIPQKRVQETIREKESKKRPEIKKREGPFFYSAESIKFASSALQFPEIIASRDRNVCTTFAAPERESTKERTKG